MFNYFLTCFQKTEKQFDDRHTFKMDVLLLLYVKFKLMTLMMCTKKNNFNFLTNQTSGFLCSTECAFLCQLDVSSHY